MKAIVMYKDDLGEIHESEADAEKANAMIRVDGAMGEDELYYYSELHVDSAKTLRAFLERHAVDIRNMMGW